MSKIFEFNANKGSLIDQVSGTAGTIQANSVGFKKTEKGLALLMTNNDDWYNLGQTIVLSSGRTLVVNIKPTKLDSYYSIFGDSQTTDGYARFGSAAPTRYIEIEDKSANAATLDFGVGKFKPNEWYQLVFIWQSSDNKIKCYVNANDGTLASATLAANLDVTRLGYGYVDKDFYGYFSGCQLYNHELSSQERAKLYDEFLHSYPINPPKTGFILNKPTDLSRYSGSGAGQGLVAAYSFVPVRS